MPNMFLKGYPNSYYHLKPNLFDLHYFICLSYFCCDCGGIAHFARYDVTFCL